MHFYLNVKKLLHTLINGGFVIIIYSSGLVMDITDIFSSFSKSEFFWHAFQRCREKGVHWDARVSSSLSLNMSICFFTVLLLFSQLSM